MTATFTGQVSDTGKLELLNLAGWRALLRHLAGKRVVVTVARPRKARSLNQNRYLWGVVYKTIGDELGYTQEEIHEHCKFRFLRLEAEPEKGRVLETVKSTADLKTDEFEEYLESIRIWAASDLGIVVPLPGEHLG